MKPLVIYHDNCADGFGAAFAAWLKLGDEAEYLPMQYGKIPEIQDLRDLVDAREVYVLDFSLPRIAMDELFTTAKRVVWLDHHKTAFEMWTGRYIHGDELRSNTCHEEATNLPYIILSSTQSGAMLAWEYFHPGEEVPMLIKHIDDYDRWQFNLGGTKEFMKAVWSYAPWTFEQWDTLVNKLVGSEKLLYSEGSAILRAHEQNVQTVVKGSARRCCLFSPPDIVFNPTPPSGLAANCPPHLASDVGHELANRSGTYGLLWYIDKDGKCKCSLRSNGDYDVSAIAKSFGGGGHKNAAGFETEITTLLGWIK